MRTVSNNENKIFCVLKGLQVEIGSIRRNALASPLQRQAVERSAQSVPLGIIDQIHTEDICRVKSTTTSSKI